MSAPRRPGDSPRGAGQPGQGPQYPPRPGTPGASAGPQQTVRDPRTGRHQTPPAGLRPPAAQQRQPVDLATRLDGQRGWLKELDESLKKRSIIALVLTCLAVGVGAAALYISITKNADGDRITALEQRISALETATGGGPDATGATTPEVPSTGVTPPATGITPDTGGVTPGSVPPTGTTETLPGITPGE